LGGTKGYPPAPAPPPLKSPPYRKVKVQFKLFSPSPQPLQPTPKLKAVQKAADNIAARMTLLEQVRSLPEGGYAILITMTPSDTDGLIIKDYAYPVGNDQLTYHGLYNYAAEYFARRISG
jgi:hypothetical protein